MFLDMVNNMFAHKNVSMSSKNTRDKILAQTWQRSFSILHELGQKHYSHTLRHTIAISKSNFEAALGCFKDKNFIGAVDSINLCRMQDDEESNKIWRLPPSLMAMIKFLLAECKLQLGHMKEAYLILSEIKKDYPILSGLKENLVDYAELIRIYANSIITSLPNDETTAEHYLIDNKHMLDKAIDLYKTINIEVPPKAKLLELKFKWIDVCDAAIIRFTELQVMRIIVLDEKRYNQDLKSSVEQYANYAPVMNEQQKEILVKIKVLAADSDARLKTQECRENRAKLYELRTATAAFLESGNLPKALKSLRAERDLAKLIASSDLNEVETPEHYARSIQELSDRVELFNQRGLVGAAEIAKVIIDKAFTLNAGHIYSQSLSRDDYARIYDQIVARLTANWYKFDCKNVRPKDIEIISKKLSEQIEWGCCSGPSLFFKSHNAYIIDWKEVTNILKHHVDCYAPMPLSDSCGEETRNSVPTALVVKF